MKKIVLQKYPVVINIINAGVAGAELIEYLRYHIVTCLTRSNPLLIIDTYIGRNFFFEKKIILLETEMGKPPYLFHGVFDLFFTNCPGFQHLQAGYTPGDQPHRKK